MNRKRKYGNAILALILVLSWIGVSGALAAPDMQGTISISEIRIDQPSTDIDEYFELSGPSGLTLDGLTYLVIGDGTGGSGVIEAVIDLTGQAIPASGFFVAAESTFSLASADLTVNLNFENSDNVTHLLVVGFTGSDGDDLDADDDGVLDAAPWSAELDRVALLLEPNPPVGTEFHYGPPSVGPDGSFVPGHVFTCSGEWQIGLFDPSSGQDTPGSANACGTEPPMPAADPVINEFVFNHVGNDTHEFVEIFGDPVVDYSAFTVLQIEGDGTGAGVVDSVIAVGSTDGAGFWTLGFTGNAFENGTLTLLAVEEFTGTQGMDLDTDNDGNLDSTPWTRVVDDVAVIDGGASDRTYAATVLDASFDGGSFTVGGASRLPNGSDSDSTADWIRNDFDGEGLPGFTGTPEFGEAFNTPGQVNAAVPAAAPTIVINEIDYDQPSTDTAEYIELYNNGTEPTSLEGLTLELVNGTGGGASGYNSIALPAVDLPAGDYFVICGGAANVANCDLDVSPDTNLIQNGAPDAVGLRYNGELIDAVSYEGDTGAPYTEGSGTGLEDAGDGGISRCPDGADTDQNNVDFMFKPSTPGSTNDCAPPPPPEACGDDFTPIYAVQGSGLSSPLVGSEVAVEGIVVGDFQNNASPDNGDLNGFHVQDSAGDGDPATSDGIFVYAPGGMDVNLGDAVRVRGSVSEFNSLTEISASQIWFCSSGNTVDATPISLPVSSLESFESYESMLVVFPQTLYISEYFNFDRFGEIVLTPQRLYQPTASFAPGSPAAEALADENERSRITLDDGRTSQNPDPALHPNGGIFDLTNRFRGGDQLLDVTGVMDYAFGLYRIQPTQGADYVPGNPRPTSPEAVGGEIRVASFNVLNYFTTLDNSGPICGPASNQDCRGADNAPEFTRQRDKIISALAALDADIVGVIEIENHPDDAAMADLVAGLNDAVGAGTYAYIDTGPIGTDAIKVGLLYKPARVTPAGAYAILDSSVDPAFLDTKNRPVLAQTFESNSDGALLTVAVNHLKSKGSSCDDVGDPEDPDGQGNCNQTRTAAAQALAAWLAPDPTSSGDTDFLIIGDLNSYDLEDPITALLGAGYTDLVRIFEGANAYTYVFDGQLGYLDHALANLSLLPQVTGLTTWHINADEPDILDYDTSFKKDAQDALYEPNPFRSSDHDPVLVGLSLNVAPVCGAAYPSVEGLWPVNHKFAAVEILGLTDPDGDPITVTIESIFQDEPVNGSGDGSTAPDAFGYMMDVALLRAERDGGGNGRVYHVTFRATDPLGYSCTGSIQVGVPLNQGKQGAAVDDGPLYDSMLVP